MTKAVGIIGLGHCIPEKVMTNDDLSKIVDTSDEWIVERTGIKERHLIEGDVATSDIATIAATNYCYELTKSFNQFYHDYSILGADNESEKIFRLVLAQNVAKTIKNAMNLLGIEVPERM